MKELFEILFGFVAAPVLIIIAVFVMRATFNYIGVDVEPVISIVVATSPIWLPFLLFYLFFDKWMYYIRRRFAIQNGRTTLRINLPPEVYKSPEAMESVMAQIHNVQSADNLFQIYLDGKHPLIFSFELVSIGGDVRFYVNVPTGKSKNAIEAQLYAQYPGIEVVEEQFDYTAEVTWNPEKYDMIAFHMNKKEDEVFPIKTYIDYGMDKLPKEELKFEPMAPMLEQLASYKPHERVWIQFLCRPHAKKAFKTGYLKNTDTWESNVFTKIDEIMGRNSKTKLGPDEREDQPRLTMGERDTITAMERNVGKYAYETAIRWIYITETGKFDGNAIAPTIRTFAQYDMIKRNQIGVKWRTDFNYNMFQDRSGKKKLKMKKEELRQYKERMFDSVGQVKGVQPPQVFSVEELATMYHIPGSAIVTPGVARIPSTRKAPPPNLPVGLPT